MTEANLLFCAAGRRVSLLRQFKSAMTELNISGKIIAADAGTMAPASYVADETVLVPRVDAPNYIAALLDICVENKIKMLTSLIDTDLLLISEHKQQFENIGVKLLLCAAETNAIAFDKIKTNEFFVSNNIDTPRTLTDNETQNLTAKDLPVLLKPWDGSSSVGVHKVENLDDLQFYLETVKHAMVQEFISGEEYTVDVYVNFNGQVKCAVPRKRLEVRAGEVSKALTERDQMIIDKTVELVQKLPGALGCVTVQCFKTKDDKVKFIEINPRFGGGFPLSVHAGANFPKWIIQELCGLNCEANFGGWEDDLLMLRYDDEIIVKGSVI